jgi:hypothetical protein
MKSDENASAGRHAKIGKSSRQFPLGPRLCRAFDAGLIGNVISQSIVCLLASVLNSVNPLQWEWVG